MHSLEVSESENRSEERTPMAEPIERHDCSRYIDSLLWLRRKHKKTCSNASSVSDFIDVDVSNKSFEVIAGKRHEHACSSSSSHPRPLQRTASRRLIACGVPPQVPVELTWKNLRVTIHGDHEVLHGLNGHAHAGEVLAIMGPSGSGKTTLLDAIAGRLNKTNEFSGEILVNGRHQTLKFGTAAYVTQEDTFIGTLTVYETVMYSACLRLPDRVTNAEKREIVDTALRDMGLQSVSKRTVGNWHLRGISGGEKRRLSIAIAILTRPRLLFLDEPTSGLDSAASYFVMRTLRNLARGGRTLLASVHQPSTEVFELFDTLFLLSKGNTIYFGPAVSAQEHFASAGFPCPTLRNPSDHFLRCINSDFDDVNKKLEEEGISVDSHYKSIDPLNTIKIADVVNQLLVAYENSNVARAAMEKVNFYASRPDLPVLPEGQGSQASFYKQFITLTSRSFTNMRRDYGYYWLRVVMYVLLCFVIGYIFHNLEVGFKDIYGRAACLSFVVGFLTFMSIGCFPSFVEEMKVMTRERMNGHYGVLPYTLANFVSALPFLLLIALLSSLPGYFLPKLHPGFIHWLYYVLILFASLSVVESLMMDVAAMVPNFLMGIITGASIMGVLLLVSGFYRLPNYIPSIITRFPLFYMNFFMYALQGMYKNEFIGITFRNDIEGSSGGYITGKRAILSIYEVGTARSKWWDLGILCLMSVVYRFIFVLLIKFFETLWPTLEAYAKRTKFKWKQLRVPADANHPRSLSIAPRRLSLRELSLAVPELGDETHLNSPLTHSSNLNSPHTDLNSPLTRSSNITSPHTDPKSLRVIRSISPR